MASASAPPVKDMKSLGVTRVSIGPAAIKVAMGAVKGMAEELYTAGTYASFNLSPISYQEMNGYFQ
jgi:2-methylisocitrate lyase-like PEP mutase family enzyme